jgi:hypothetical protein
MKRLTVGILGNFNVSFTTESELSWTFKRLGHFVLEFQENAVTTDDVVQSCINNGADLCLYIHTHGWSTPGSFSVDELLNRLRQRGIITASFHLDLHFGLNVWDKREDTIGHRPEWKADYVFTADGGHEEEFANRGVNHFWLPPAVVEHGCHVGRFDPTLACDVAFVGSQRYHPEYPFRGELIDFLQRTYGVRFRLYNGYREARLNDLYASVKVCVGDSCFAGMPRYWSDRIPETCGRGGFLLHPPVQGLDIPGLCYYERQNLDDLQSKIDYYLARPETRADCVKKASAHVAEFETYTNRVRDMLSVMRLDQEDAGSISSREDSKSAVLS